jgi:hypothetical protein
MNTTHKLDEVNTPETTANAWDYYLHRCGPGRTSRHGTVLPSAPRHPGRVRIVWNVWPQIDHDPFGRVWLRRPELTGGVRNRRGGVPVHRVELVPSAPPISPASANHPQSRVFAGF